MEITDLLGEFRSGELASACRVLALPLSGVKQQRVERLVALIEDPKSGVDTISVFESLPKQAQVDVLDALSIGIEPKIGPARTLANLLSDPGDWNSFGVQRYKSESAVAADREGGGTSLKEIDTQSRRRGKTPEYRNEQQHLSNRTDGRNRTGPRSRSSSARAWIYAIIGIVLGLFAGALANIIVSAIGVAASGADTIGDLPAGWTFLRLLAAVGVTVLGGVLGYRMGSR